ncbi:PAS domain S-box protein [Marivirga salinae]|uniref:PAS domain S-box protein n=1 Tax=Marivirga salinarum TaxID=3059078 RepID=A0AA51NA79_9BACT|nr:PAS domain S-box protein [Marivirga sp. BDSF4-3]WMN11532.1 PAS domain S-box protein [Marivirga sp. BDSF4-3]
MVKAATKLEENIAPKSKEAKSQKSNGQDLENHINAVNNAFASVEFDPQGNILNANDQFLITVGYSLKEIKGEHHRIFVSDDFAGSDEYKAFWKSLAAGDPQNGEFLRFGKTGNEIWLQASYTPIPDESGQIVKVIKYALDITKKKKEAQEAYLVAQEYEKVKVELNTRMEQIDIACLVSESDLKGNITFVNDKLLEVTGYTREECIGQPHSMFRHADSPKSLFKEMWATIGKGNIFRGEIKNRKKNGDPYFVDAIIAPVLGPNGKPVKYIGVRYDITEQKLKEQEVITAMEESKKAEEEATETAKKFQAMETELETRMDQINVACLVSESDLKGNITFVNDKLLEVTGYTREECIGQPHSMFRHEDSPKSLFKEMWSTIGRGNIFRGEIKNRKKNGDPYFVDAIIAPVLGPNGKPVKYIGVRYDITEQKLKEQEIQQAMEEQSDVIEVIRAMAKGDLTQRVQNDSDVAGEVNSALDNLNDVLNSINNGAEVVSTSSGNLLKRSEGIKNSSNEVASAISQMAKGAQDQALRTDESSKLVDGVMKSSQEMQSKADFINKTAQDGQKRSEEGLKIIKNLVENMTGIDSSAIKTSESIAILTERAEEIGRTLNVITDIASQTNLLALNAAIEAARAGDAGRGFAVVAEEIRKLAEDSRKSAVDIEKIISDVQKDTVSAGKAIESMKTSVKEGGNATKDAESIFVEIAGSSDTTFQHSKEILSASNGQREAIEAVVKNIEQIVVVAEETAAGTQQVASSSQELNAGMVEVTDASNQLSKIAEELKSGIKKFTLTKV